MSSQVGNGSSEDRRWQTKALSFCDLNPGYAAKTFLHQGPLYVVYGVVPLNTKTITKELEEGTPSTFFSQQTNGKSTALGTEGPRHSST